MAFSPFSQIVQPAPWVDPINLDLLRQGNMYKEEIARQNLSNLSESFQALASTPAYGKDAEKLQEKMEELKSQISGLNLSDVSDYNTMGQIKGVINQFSSDPDIMDIAQKWTPYEKERKIQEEMRLKDKDYFSPIIDQGNAYIQNGEYIQNKRFTGNGFINKNLTKEYQEVLSKLQKQKKQVVKNGVVTEELSYDPDELDRITDEFYSNPAFKQQIEYQINKDSNVDWEKQGQQILTKHADVYKNNISLKEQELLITKDPKKYQEIAQDIESYKQEVSKLEQMAASQDNAEYAKSYYINNMLDDLKTQAKEKAQFFSEESRKYDEVYMEGVKTNNNIRQEKEKQILELELASGISRNTPDFYKTASAIVQQNKQKNAAAVAEGLNPDIKLKRQVPAGGLSPTWQQATEGLGNKQDETIPEERLKYHLNNILENEKYFKYLMKSTYTEEELNKIITTLKKNKQSYNSGLFSKDIKVLNKTMVVDPDGTGEYLIPKNVLENLVNNQYNKTYGGEDLNIENNNTTQPAVPGLINGFKTTQYTVNNDTITAPIITNLSDTNKIDKGAYFSYNGELYKN